MPTRRFGTYAAWAALCGLLAGGCASVPSPPGASSGASPAGRGSPTLAEGRARLLARLDTLRVAGVVKTRDGLVLPETIRIEIRTEVCTESRPPGSRFWSLDYDTCFVFVSFDTVDAAGGYEVALPCLDADRDYQDSFPFGDLRLVPKGPVSFLAESDGGWRHQETFSSSRSQQRDLLLSFEPNPLYVVTPKALLRARPDSAASEMGSIAFGEEMQVIRFHLGWAECLFPTSIGWMEMRCLGTKDEVTEREPHYRKAGLLTEN